MRNNIWANTLTSISTTALSFMTEALPLLQLIAVLLAIVSGAGAVHIAVLKKKLLKEQLKEKKRENIS